MARKSLRRKPEFTVRKTPFLVILGFMILGLIGISTGEPQRVLEQAIRVCLSCIGIG
ncbi:CD1871A family CXXC motif-containing protein [Desulfurivibrio sp. D14AmB]|uniref:CD1871A family CXXC motif-containing protein n=1 Tax=Desulfurivibrio sp. D14AmB TaxID=3374370 RepID=UPI00376EB300